MADEKELVFRKKVGPLGVPIPLPIRSNNLDICLDCGVKITPENDSGWEAFTEDGKTQPICKTCDERQVYITEKEDDSVKH